MVARRLPSRLLPVLLALGVGGCGIFGGDDETEEPPAELSPIEATVDVDRLWSARIGDGSERLHVGLRLATDGARIFAASVDGSVSALDAADGRDVWAVDTELPLSAGPAYGDGTLVLGTSDGQVAAVAAADGVPLWTVNVSSEVLGAPAIGSTVVVVRTVDGRLHGLSLSDGSALWVVDNSVPRLSLRGVSRPAIAGDVAIVGLDDGKIVAVALDSGDVVWERPIAAPRGRTELERLADVDGAIVVAGSDVFAAGFQSRAVLLTADSGQVLWAQDLSTYRDLGIDWGQIYAADAAGSVIALDRLTGGPVWQQDAFARRKLSAPAAYGTSVVVGDFEGYLHWLATRDGSIQARARLGEAAVSAPPLVVGENLYVLSDGGLVGAFRAQTGG